MAEREELLREYAERAGAFDEMEKIRGWDFLVDRLRHDSESHRKAVLSGSLDPDKYKFECGWLAGALHAVSVPAIVRKEYETLLGQE